ncbi:Uracil-DNA glycosylase [Candidatus Terasakiella magnetica]|uniref:Uracil-DNA glycosylase n=1 Tax=Candidatus Terasakiella magnetica TaxID=1867952 RepID=A0A1C3RGA0_9PROT|nr:uracil-DNA glycosylase family protein [Candidatus Terasakiella magnetica]SCA56327.1 Uracil-DNA glycosylase [Candidatus Terasakiella magnetica]
MQKLLDNIRACTLCKDLPLGPRPIIRAQKSAKILIIGQAPGTKVHESGIPWNDASGERLRDWLHLDKDIFYDESRIAIMPMGLCYPGRVEKGGDLPPRPECAPAWHDKVLKELDNIKLTLLVGSYAQNHYLGKSKKKTMTETVKNWSDYLEKGYLPLPHPSWRVTNLIKKNPWFEAELVPNLRKIVKDLL